MKRKPSHKFGGLKEGVHEKGNGERRTGVEEGVRRPEGAGPRKQTQFKTADIGGRLGNKRNWDTQDETIKKKSDVEKVRKKKVKNPRGCGLSTMSPQKTGLRKKAQ